MYSISFSLRILWLNWRDIKSPAAGGAEVFTHEVMRRLVKMNHSITLFTARFPNSSREEDIDGIKIVRDGGKYGVYGKAKSYYKRNKDRFDIVIDEINTRPFLTPKYVKQKPILALIHHVPREGLPYELSFPLNYIYYYFLRERWLSYYKNFPTITVSNSSRQDLEQLDFKKIHVLQEGVSITPLNEMPQKENASTVVFIGRLKRYKLPDHAIQTFSLIKREIPDAKMWVIGDGYMRKELEKLNVRDVHFHGHVNEETKYRLLSKAHLVLLPAVKEGWGLVVIESNAMGTPVVAYNVHGLRDSVRDGENGILVKENSPWSLSQTAVSLLKNKEQLTKLSCSALAYSRQFSWDKTAKAVDDIMKDTPKLG